MNQSQINESDGFDSADFVSRRIVFLIVAILGALINLFIFLFVLIKPSKKDLANVDRLIFGENSAIVVLSLIFQVAILFDARILKSFNSICFLFIIFYHTLQFIVNNILTYSALMQFSTIKRDKFFVWMHKMLRDVRFAAACTLTAVILAAISYGSVLFKFKELLFFPKVNFNATESDAERFTCVAGIYNNITLVLMLFNYTPSVLLLVIYIVAAIELSKKIRESKKSTSLISTKRDKYLIKKFFINSLISLVMFLPASIERTVQTLCSQCIPLILSVIIQTVAAISFALYPLFLIMNHNKLREILLSYLKNPT